VIRKNSSSNSHCRHTFECSRTFWRGDLAKLVEALGEVAGLEEDLGAAQRGGVGVHVARPLQLLQRALDVARLEHDHPL